MGAEGYIPVGFDLVLTGAAVALFASSDLLRPACRASAVDAEKDLVQVLV